MAEIFLWLLILCLAIGKKPSAIKYQAVITESSEQLTNLEKLRTYWFKIRNQEQFKISWFFIWLNSPIAGENLNLIIEHRSGKFCINRELTARKFPRKSSTTRNRLTISDFLMNTKFFNINNHLTKKIFQTSRIWCIYQQ